MMCVVWRMSCVSCSLLFGMWCYVVCCMPFGVCCLMSVVCCFLFVVCCELLVDRCVFCVVY